MQQIKSGSKGEVVELVQRMLNEKGYACGSASIALAVCACCRLE